MTVLEGPRLTLLLAARWPLAPKKGAPRYTPRLQKAIDAGQVVACRWCGGPHPGVSGRWSTCDRCQPGADAYGSRWPLVATLDTFFRRQVDARVRERVLARRHLLVDALPGYGDLAGTQPIRPVEAWSHLRLPVPEQVLAPNGGPPLIDGVTVRSEVRVGRAGAIGRFHVEPLPGHEYPTWRAVVGAAIAGARAELDASEVCGPPNGSPSCAWCGIGSAPKREWQTVDGRPWCGQVSDCPLPIHGSPVRDRAQCVATILDGGVDALVVDQAYRAGRLPAVRFQDQPDDERERGGWTAAFGWLSDEDVEALRALLDEVARPNDERVQDALMAGRHDAALADRAQEAREAELAEIKAEAVKAAQLEVRRVAKVPRVRVEMTAAERRAREARKQRDQAYLDALTRRVDRARGR